MAPDVLYIAGFVLAVIAASMNVSAWEIDLSARTIMIILIGALSFVSVGMLYRLSHKKYAFQGCTEIEHIQVARWKNVLVIAFDILTMSFILQRSCSIVSICGFILEVVWRNGSV